MNKKLKIIFVVALVVLLVLIGGVVIFGKEDDVFLTKSRDGFRTVEDLKGASFQVPAKYLKDAKEADEVTDESSHSQIYRVSDESSYLLLKMDDMIVYLFALPRSETDTSVEQFQKAFALSGGSIRLELNGEPRTGQMAKGKIQKRVFEKVPAEVVPSTEFYNDFVGDAAIGWNEDTIYYLFAGVAGRTVQEVDAKDLDIVSYIANSLLIEETSEMNYYDDGEPTDGSLRDEEISSNQTESGTETEDTEDEREEDGKDKSDESEEQEPSDSAKTTDEPEELSEVYFEVITDAGESITRKAVVSEVLSGDRAEEEIKQYIESTIYKTFRKPEKGYIWNVAVMKCDQKMKNDNVFVDVKVLSDQKEPFKTGSRTYELKRENGELIVCYQVPENAQSYMLRLGTGTTAYVNVVKPDK